jgi:hypothetical protein
VKSISEMTQPELGAFIQTHLRNNGIDVVLSGGAAVSIHSVGKYVSKDLDMVGVYSPRRRAIATALQEIGFEEQKTRYFKHPESEHIVEFPAGPLSVGGEPVRQIDEIEYSTGILRIVSPTDCVKDRLAAYYHWGDRQSLTQAVLVAGENEIDLDEIKRWSQAEGSLNKFKEIRDQLSRNISQP